MKTGFSTNRHLLQSTVLLILLTCLTSCTVSGIRLSADSLDDAILQDFGPAEDNALMVKRGDTEVAGLWFGPRLGRRERRSADEMQDDDGKVEEMLELLKEAGWTLVPVRGGKRQTGGFIPRLGRDSDEDEDSDIMKQRSPPFAPRLGRRLVPFRPRMGRDRLPHDVYSPRLGRSIHPLQSHENKQPPQH